MTEYITVSWSLGAGGRPADVWKEIQEKLKQHGLGWAMIDTEPPSDSAYGIIYDPADAPSYLKSGYFVAFLWDWKEPRAFMIRDLNWAMKALGRDIVWQLQTKGGE